MWQFMQDVNEKSNRDIKVRNLLHDINSGWRDLAYMSVDCSLVTLNEQLKRRASLPLLISYHVGHRAELPHPTFSCHGLISYIDLSPIIRLLNHTPLGILVPRLPLQQLHPHRHLHTRSRRIRPHRHCPAMVRRHTPQFRRECSLQPTTQLWGKHCRTMHSAQGRRQDRHHGSP